MQPYTPTTDHTTAVCSLMSIINFFNPNFKLNQDNEFKIWKNTVNVPTKGASVYGLAIQAKEQGLKPIIIVEDTEYEFPDYRFYRYTKKDIEDASFSEKQYVKQANKEQIEIITRDITLNEIKPLLEKAIILLRINIKPFTNDKNSSQYIVIEKYENQEYTIIEPSQGKLQVTEEQFEEAFESLETKKHRGYRMVIFEK